MKRTTRIRQVGLIFALASTALAPSALLGSRYFQEQAAGVALDRSEHVGAGISMKLAGKTFRDCVAVAETTPLEPGHVSDKVYCPGVGLVLDNEAVLTGYKRD